MVDGRGRYADYLANVYFFHSGTVDAALICGCVALGCEPSLRLARLFKRDKAELSIG